jgi:hypothetical protein
MDFLAQIIKFTYVLRSFLFTAVYCCRIVLAYFYTDLHSSIFWVQTLPQTFALSSRLYRQAFYAKYEGIFAVCRVPNSNTTREINRLAFTKFM